MKRYLIPFCVFLSVFFTVAIAVADPTIRSVTDERGVAITGAPPGSVIRIIGSGFGATRAGSNVTLWVVSSRDYYVDLDIDYWSEMFIVARIPQCSSASWRSGPTDTTPEICPDDVREYLFTRGSPFGDMTITELVGDEYEAVSNHFRFTLQRPTVTMALLGREVSLVGGPHSCCKALHAPPVAASTSRFVCPITGPTVTSISPTSGPPGTYVEIKGRCFGNSGAGNDVRFWNSGLARPVNLEIISWENMKIVARIPQPEVLINVSGVYRIAPGRLYSLDSATLSAPIFVYLGSRALTGPNFNLAPPEMGSSPVLCNLDKTKLHSGSCFMIYGTGFGPDSTANRVYFKKGDDTEEIMDKLWTSAAIRACLPDDMEDGEYEIYISRPNDSDELMESNGLEFEVPLMRRSPSLDISR